MYILYDLIVDRLTQKACQKKNRKSNLFVCMRTLVFKNVFLSQNESFYHETIDSVHGKSE